MCDAPKYGKTRVSKVLADIDRLRMAIRAHDDEAAEQAWEKVERWTGFIAGSVSRADTITALEAENKRLREENEELRMRLDAAKKGNDRLSKLYCAVSAQLYSEMDNRDRAALEGE